MTNPKSLHELSIQERMDRLDQLLKDQNETALAMDQVMLEAGQLAVATRRYRGVPAQDWVIITEFMIASNAEHDLGTTRNKIRVEALSWGEALEAGQGGYYCAATITVEPGEDGAYGLRLDPPAKDHLLGHDAGKLATQLATAQALRNYDLVHYGSDSFHLIRADQLMWMDDNLTDMAEHSRKWGLQVAGSFPS